MNETDIQIAMQRCKHSNGMTHTECDAGVRKSDLPNLTACMRFLTNKTRPQCECEKAQYPTREGVEAEDKDIHLLIEKIETVRKAIVEDIGEARRRQSVSGTIPCPVCQGTVRYTYAGNYNRHIHASCSTEGCVRWME